MIDAVPARDLEVEQPAVDAIDLDRHDHGVRARQRVDPFGVALDGDAARVAASSAAASCAMRSNGAGSRSTRRTVAPVNTGSA